MREWARILRPSPIALDATYSIGRHLSGVGVYSREILNGLAERYRDQRFLFCYRPHRFFPSFRDTGIPPNASRALLRHGGISRGVQLFHALNQRVDRKFAPTVTTFHDLFVITGEYSTADFRQRFTLQAKQAASASDLIIAVSEFTASQVVSLLGVPPSRVRVIPHGVRRPAETPPSDDQRENLILSVGAIQPVRTPRDWSRHSRASSRGGAWSSPVIRGELERADPSADRAQSPTSGHRSCRLRRPAYSQRLYGRARIFAFPSLDEGFGMPILDAMACGVPVLTSNRSALPEVAGDAALSVDPDSVDDISRGLRQLTTDLELRDALRQSGLRRVAIFSWDRSVEMTWAVYAELD